MNIKGKDIQKAEWFPGHISIESVIPIFQNFSMNLDDFLKPPLTLPLCFFKKYYEEGNKEKAACELKYSFEACLKLCTKQFIHELILWNEDSIFCSIVYSLNRRGYSIDPLIDPSDFLIACKKCSSMIIAIIACHPHVEITPMLPEMNKQSPLEIIMDRNDPDILNNCLNLIPELVSIQPPQSNTLPLYYILNNQLENLIDEMWILINAFNISNDDLMVYIRYWRKYYAGKPLIPILEEVFNIHILENQFDIEKYREREYKPVEYTCVTDLDCLDAKINMEEGDKLRNFLMERKSLEAQIYNNQPYNFEINFDPESPNILMQLPYTLLSNKEMMLRSHLYLTTPLIGHDAIGEGPVQDMFNAYFRQLSSEKYFDSDIDGSSIVPKANALPLDEQRCVFYGLGVVFLKELIDLRNIDNFIETKSDDTKTENDTKAEDDSENQNINIKSSLNYSWHPWFFRALLQKEKTDPKTMLYESLFSSHELYNRLTFNIKENDYIFTIDNLVKNINHIRYSTNRKPLYQAMHDGFWLNYVEGITPSSLKNNLFEIKSELQTFYDKIRDVTPGALQLLLVGPPIIEYEFLLSHFDFMAYEKVDTSSFGENDVIKSDFSPVEKDLFDRSVSYIKQILKDWCGELPDQTHLRRFLQYLFGVPTISPLFQSKWRFYIDFSLHHCSMLMAWSCENTIRTPIFRTFESCLEAFQSTITGFEADPKSRDMAHTSNQND